MPTCADVARADLGPAEQPVLSPHRDHPQGALEVVGVDGNIRVAEVDPQRRLATVGIHQRLGERRAVHQIEALALGVTPAEEGVDHGQGVAAAVGELGFALEFPVADRLLDLVQGTDQRERLLGRRLAVAGALEVPPAMRPTVRLGDLGFVLGERVVGAVAVGQQGAGEVLELGLDVGAAARLGPGEAELGGVAVQRPVPGRLQLAVPP